MIYGENYLDGLLEGRDSRKRDLHIEEAIREFAKIKMPWWTNNIIGYQVNRIRISSDQDLTNFPLEFKQTKRDSRILSAILFFDNGYTVEVMIGNQSMSSDLKPYSVGIYFDGRLSEKETYLGYNQIGHRSYQQLIRTLKLIQKLKQ